MILTYVIGHEKNGVLSAESVTAEKFWVSTVLHGTVPAAIPVEEWRALAESIAPEHGAVIVSDVRGIRWQRVSIDQGERVVVDPEGDHVQMAGLFLAIRTGQPLPPKFWVDGLPAADLYPREM